MSYVKCSEEYLASVNALVIILIPKIEYISNIC